MFVHSQDQILMLMNKCSKHRGLFKPPLTPERFWDADILEVEYNWCLTTLTQVIKINYLFRMTQTIPESRLSRGSH